jgi:hypothetical protein
MVVNFRVRGISRGIRKLARTFMLIKKIKTYIYMQQFITEPETKKIFLII